MFQHSKKKETRIMTKIFCLCKELLVVSVCESFCVFKLPCFASLFKLTLQSNLK